jgi:HD-like signal output (HDOD) protein
MLTELAPKEADKILRGMVIPPRPTILLQLETLQKAESPNFAAIAHKISEDLTLSAAVLKAINSPYYGLSTKIASVQQALHLLGLRNVGKIVRGLALKQAIDSASAEKMEMFWLQSTRVAHLAEYLASHLHGIAADEAYTFGLFHNCGMPLMLSRFADYQNTLHQSDSMARNEFIALENQRHKTSHNVVGYLLGRTWYLPEHINLAILNHHNYSIFTGKVDNKAVPVANLIALASLAEHMVREHSGQFEHEEWRQIEPLLLQHLGMLRTEYEDLSDKAHSLLDEIQAG